MNLLNPVLTRWLENQPALIPAVDCHGCTLAALRPEFARRWHDYKCCTFQPFVANFLCGAMLEAGLDPLAIDESKARLSAIGVIASHEMRVRRDSAADDERGEAELCSYYDLARRRCRVWEFRPGECSVHYCAPKMAPEREEFSRRSFQLEAAVAQMALVELGYAPRAIENEINHLNHPAPELKSLSRRQARDLYLAAWEWAKRLGREEVLSWLDSASAGE